MQYNTARNHLILPEYGRNVQKMVEHASNIKDKTEREKCVKSIIKFMGQTHPQLRDIKEFTHKLWDHLHIMSNFNLDVQSPYPKPELVIIFVPSKKYSNQASQTLCYAAWVDFLICLGIAGRCWSSRGASAWTLWTSCRQLSPR